ncbi:conserved Plasmodium membrane protein, unknown function [Plasmodium relictum]|uniref:Uncharacterized protein n=1 Tax=Plasmodium relictum TaxID=85471 RepID=A0A1J1H436_PLARL|nr:conserved Plasmodium membrane protein, unknown function [Plasmodium relictum]CRG99668.1 conserved Plasmodium membrane protein, unknown function [Plasmodium relictum]
MLQFGKMSKCCCFSLAGGCISAIIFHIILCITQIFSEEDNKIWIIVSSSVLAVLIILGLALKNYIIMIIVSIFAAIFACSSIITLIFIIISLFKKDQYNIETKVLAIISTSIIIIIIILYFNIYLSTSRVFKVGGTGWEYKNYIQIEEEKAEKDKEAEPEHSGDYKA